MSARPRAPLWLLALLSAIAPGAMHIVTPSLPLLAAFFARPPGSVQLVLTLYVAGIAPGQLLIGPISDRFGRRPVLLCGLVLFLAGTVMCGAAPSLGALIAGRLLQAVGGCAGLVLARAMIRDIFDRERAAAAIASVAMAMTLGTSMSPAIGAYLAEWFGWRADFAFLGAFGAAMLLLSATRLDETHAPSEGLGLGGLGRDAAELARLPVFAVIALSNACTSASWLTFTAIAPYLLSSELHRPPSTYGVAIILPMSCYIAGTLLTARLATRLGSLRLFALGLTISLVAAAMLGLWTLGLGLSPWSMMVPMAVSQLGNGLSLPPGLAAGLSVEPRLAGTASGLMGFLQMAVAAAGTYLVARLPQRGGLWMVVVVGAFLFGAWLFGIMALRALAARAGTAAAAAGR
jgi:MFS transporter, DHA1 family, multidrug resistance protein